MLEARNGECIDISPSEWDGEGLPVEGCTAKTSGGECTVLAVDESRHQAAVRWLNNGELGIVKIAVIKPIKPGREKWIEDCEEFISGYATWEAAAAAIHDAILSGKLKLPEVE